MTIYSSEGGSTSLPQEIYERRWVFSDGALKEWEKPIGSKETSAGLDSKGVYDSTKDALLCHAIIMHAGKPRHVLAKLYASQYHPGRQPAQRHRSLNVEVPPPVLIFSIWPIADDRSIPEIVGIDLSALPPVQPAVVFPDRVSSCSCSSSSYTSGLGPLSFLGTLSAPHTGPPSRGALTFGPQVILVRLVVVGGFEVWVVLLIMLRDAMVV